MPAVLAERRLTYTHPLPFLAAIATHCVFARHFFGEACLHAYRAQLLQEWAVYRVAAYGQAARTFSAPP